MVKHILVGVSHDADCAALRFAIGQAREHNAYISVLHVVDWMPQMIVAECQDFGPMLACLQEHGREIVGNVSRKLEDSGCRGEAKMITLSVKDFTVGKAIATFARDIGADLIVLGKAKSAWWRWFGGNVYAEVQRHSDANLFFASSAKTLARTISRPLARLALSH
ncbi:universal stress protein [Dyella monticola]|uniref:Universal stress protein n=1 Tax=Dyella monticola TaxID=1927958 RepID=A0A370WY96_9GAMM|nr:universal stress protein [Dyella monticola]RDS81134.1 universal stress protein [Dyella monticola]